MRSLGGGLTWCALARGEEGTAARWFQGVRSGGGGLAGLSLQVVNGGEGILVWVGHWALSEEMLPGAADDDRRFREGQV